MQGSYGLYVTSVISVANCVIAGNAVNPVPNGLAAIVFALLAIAWRPLP